MTLAVTVSATTIAPDAVVLLVRVLAFGRAGGGDDAQRILCRTS